MKSVVCEGAQGTLLDIDHGKLPFVTSFSPKAGGALTGLGIGPCFVSGGWVAKAFSTRVGGGPMPTSSTDDIAEHPPGSGLNFWDEFWHHHRRHGPAAGWISSCCVMLRREWLERTDVTRLSYRFGLDQLNWRPPMKIDVNDNDYPPVTNEQFAARQPFTRRYPMARRHQQGAAAYGDLPAAARAYSPTRLELCDVR